MKVLFSGFKDCNHSSSGGYHKVTNIPIKKKIVLLSKFPFGKNLKNKFTKIARALLQIYTMLISNNFEIIHYFYADITISHYLPFYKSKKNKLVATLHMDFDKPMNNKKYYIKILRKFDGIIVLSSQQEKLLINKYQLKAKFIPHGFNDIDFKFTLPKDNKNNNININTNLINICVIGNNYRDFDTLEEIINKKYSNIHFHLIGIPKNIKEKYTKHNNVTSYNRLNDDEYYSLISICDYNFLPLTFATANNTLLESQSLNTISILPLIDGITDYASKDNIFYKNIDQLMTIFSNLKKYSKNEKLSIFVKENFNWDKIYNNILDYYEKI